MKILKSVAVLTLAILAGTFITQAHPVIEFTDPSVQELNQEFTSITHQVEALFQSDQSRQIICINSEGNIIYKITVSDIQHVQDPHAQQLLEKGDYLLNDGRTIYYMVNSAMPCVQ